MIGSTSSASPQQCGATSKTIAALLLDVRESVTIASPSSRKQSQAISDLRECRVHFEDTPEIVLFLSDGDTTEENPMVSEEDRRNQAVETEEIQEINQPSSSTPAPPQTGEAWLTWLQHHDALEKVFKKMEKLTKDKSLDCRTRFLLQVSAFFIKVKTQLVNEPLRTGSRRIRCAGIDRLAGIDALGDSPEALASPAANDSDSDLGSAADSRLRVRVGQLLGGTATQYNGVAWEDMVIPGTGEMHVFTIGDPGPSIPQFQDWGTALSDRTGLHPEPQWRHRPESAYSTRGLLWEQFSAGGTGLHVYPFIRPSLKQKASLQRSYVVVAEQMKKRAEKTGCFTSLMKTGVQYILNVGDNFYPQGMNTGCGSPMNQIKEATKVQFEKAFNWVYLEVHG
ncbi:hypothetical protein AK812_SmicGene8468 [Symbiodinium microadriaticum]|uniref:Uncharacterized protein n=1 Tax=Symbiodinium microadriaticum TaxID=2951 RepID=A0A1Q9EKW6_SYMMI|nr:hypothetical protein AK812_SmicGene8468 [Symbiodinium microadriaticum]